MTPPLPPILTDRELYVLAHLNPDVPAHRDAIDEVRTALVVALRREEAEQARSAQP